MALAFWKHPVRDRADAVRAPLADLRRMAKGILNGVPAPPGALSRIVIATGLGEAGLTDADRELVWRAFGLPVFEELKGPAGETLAVECEAHAGLHLVGGDPCLLGGAFRIERGECACGQTGPRVCRTGLTRTPPAG